MQIFRLNYVLCCILFLFNIVVIQINGQSPGLEKINYWNNVTGFAINSEENYLVLAVREGDEERLYESFLDEERWSSLVPIESINNYLGGVLEIGGPSFYYDGRTLFYHARYEEGEGGFDIYYSERSSDGWGRPVRMGETINSSADEFYPVMAVGEQSFYFSRNKSGADVRKPRRSPDCQWLYVAEKNNLGEWDEPRPLHDVINIACEYGLFVAKDGKTVYLSSVDQNNHRDGYNIYYAREMGTGAWLLPVLIDKIASGETNINPRIAGEHIYFLRQTESRREITGSIYRTKLPDDYKPLHVKVSQGKIVDLENEAPIQSGITVFDPTTLETIGDFYSDKQTGEFQIPLLDEENYIVDVRNPAYSFASFQVDYRENVEKSGPDRIELFDTAELEISVYDSEIFRPLEAEVWVETLSDSNTKVKARETEPGVYTFDLPVGHEYKLVSNADGFEEDSFDLNLLGDIIFSRFERNLPLTPQKRAFDIYIKDSETSESVNAEITFKNLTRDETFSYSTIAGSEEQPDIDNVPVPEIESVPEIGSVPATESVVVDDELADISFTNPRNQYRYALIIGNEDYSSYQVRLESESDVEFAIRDAETFRLYAHNVLGVPEDNIMFLTNGRAIEMHDHFKKIKNVMETLEGKAEVLFYFAGHGFPDEQTKEPYIMPVDVSGSNLEFAIKLKDVYSMLTEHPSDRVTVFLDACFSGGARNVGLISARGVRVRPQEHLLDGNIVVFSASSSRQSAHPYREKRHGMFTYYLLEKMRETKGNISYKTLADYMRETVGVRAVIINNVEQTPEINVSPAVDDLWQDWSFN